MLADAVENTARAVTMVGFGAATSIALGVLVVYFQRIHWRERPLREKHAHIALLALVSAATWIGLGVERARRWNDPATWETWYWAPIAAAAAVGQLLIYRYERRVTHGLTEPTD